MVRADDERLKSFVEKLKEEGASGFTSGPLSETPGIGSHTGQVAAGRSGQRWQSVISQLLTIVFVLLLAVVVVFYLMHQAELDTVSAQLDSIMKAPVRDGLEQRLTYVENRLAQRNDPYAQRLEKIEQGLTDNRRLYEQRLQDVEQQLVQSHGPYEGRLHDIEQQLVQLRTSDLNSLRDVEKKLLHMTARLDEWTAVMARLSGNEKVLVAANMDMTAEPPSAVSPEPVVVGRNDEVLLQARDTAAIPPGQGDWVVNIASYVREKTAARKLAYFQGQGIAADQVAATIDGKTIYRVQVAGFYSLAAARVSAREIGDQLGIEDLWVRRR